MPDHVIRKFIISMDQESKLHNLLRKTSKEARYEARHHSMAQKRIGFEVRAQLHLARLV